MDDGISGSVPGSIRWRSLSADQKGDKYQISLCREEEDADESQVCLASAGGLLYLKTFARTALLTFQATFFWRFFGLGRH